MKKIIKILLALIMCFSVFSLTSCNAEDSVQHNLLTDTANFKTYRKISVINMRSDKVLMEFEGYLTTKIDADKDVNIMIMVGPGQYKLHYVHLADEVVYVSEQIENTSTDPYHWNVRVFAVLPNIQVGA